ncbi:Putative cell wall binding repeat-containing protein [Ruminococcaceae bacterium YRB3002]|nr:Putative cell wall binding repeat-containing protein [Ruminococcaceae bacterium YRB3002]
MGFKKFMAAALTVGMIASFVPSTVMAAKPGWEGNDEDGWYYYTSETEYLKDTWKQIGSYWYFFDEEGKMARDSWWSLDDNPGDGIDRKYWYHFDKSGHMNTNRWIEDIYRNEQGQIVQRDWSFVDRSGKAVTGWNKIGGVWYYFDTYAYMCCNELAKDTKGDLYYFDSNGRYIRNKWKQVDGDWFYFGSNGIAYKGWHKISGKWYYFDDEIGFMYRGWQDIGEKVYCFDNSGAMVTGWYRYELGDGEYVWLYASSGGELYRNRWLKSNGVWYYFRDNCTMVSGVDNYEIGGKLYDFTASGACKNPYSGRPAAA